MKCLKRNYLGKWSITQLLQLNNNHKQQAITPIANCNMSKLSIKASGRNAKSLPSIKNTEYRGNHGAIITKDINVLVLPTNGCPTVTVNIPRYY